MNGLTIVYLYEFRLKIAYVRYERNTRPIYPLKPAKVE